MFYAGYISGFIRRNNAGVAYPAPPHGPDGVPDDAPEELHRALRYWSTNHRLQQSVQDGILVKPLPPLEWLEDTNQVGLFPFFTSFALT
jgi:hypothetical protein